jgi:hypothetical protein
VDEDTALFNIEIIKEYQINRMHPYKIMHLQLKNILMIITDAEGEKTMINMMRRLFMFQEIYDSEPFETKGTGKGNGERNRKAERSKEIYV